MNATAENINAEDLNRAMTEAELARQAGFALAQPIYALGAPVNEVGAENYALSRKAFEKLPRMRDVVRNAKAQLAAEERRDIKVPLSEVEMHDDGRVSIAGVKGAHAIRKRAFEQMLYRASMPRGSASYLEASPPPLRSLNVNEWLRIADSEVILRTRRGAQGGREVFATLSTHRYHAYDAEQMMDILADKLPPGARGELRYDGSRFLLTAQYHSDIQPERCVAGELFKAAVVIDTADDGTRAIRVRAAVTRNLCRNLIILHTAKKDETATHLDVDLDEKIPRLIESAVERIKGFAERWTEATRDKIAAKALDQYDVTPIFEKLIEEGLVELTNVEDEQMLQLLLRAWQKEPGNTRAHILNAITRAAHEEVWRNPWASNELEEQAGKLLYNFQLWS